LEEGFPDLWVEGEVSNLRIPSSGHLYFTLKDEASQIRAVLFRAGAQRLRFSLKEGLHVVVRGHLTVYGPRGEYQIVLDYVEPKGLGALQLALEQLKEQLAREGLFDPSRKRPLPFLPRRVGLVTSLAGAAIRDMLAVLHRRCPVLGVVIAPVPVQGKGSAPAIAGAIRTLGSSGLVDVMIVGRGGGSLEDLWSFNEEVVVRAIAGSPVPVVSAVGHEIDVTLADFAADYRAPTPSAAAEAVSPVLADLYRTLDDFSDRLTLALRGQLDREQQACDASLRALHTRLLPIERVTQQLDDLADRLNGSVQDLLARFRQQWRECRHRLETASPGSRVRSVLVLAPQLAKRMEQGILALLSLKRQVARSLAASLDSLSPLAILARGYSIVQTVPGGEVVKRANEVAAGDQVRVRLAMGQLLCDVRRILSDS
jgi:exodeoxyribonuclease VII large subunit